jgi:hypothetical protein
MTAPASTVPRQRTAHARPARMFFDVVVWELRRFYASRATRWTVLLAFGLFLVLGWVLAILRFAGTFVFGNGATFDVAVTSAWGTSMVLPTLTFLLALVLPFVSADGVARDLKQRTHELLLSSPLPTWAYVLGRYLACLLLTLGLAALLLVTLLLDGVALHLTQRATHCPIRWLCSRSGPSAWRRWPCSSAASALRWEPCCGATPVCRLRRSSPCGSSLP